MCIIFRMWLTIEKFENKKNYVGNVFGVYLTHVRNKIIENKKKYVGDVFLG